MIVFGVARSYVIARSGSDEAISRLLHFVRNDVCRLSLHPWGVTRLIL